MAKPPGKTGPARDSGSNPGLHWLIAASPREAAAETIEAALARAYQNNPTQRERASSPERRGRSAGALRLSSDHFASQSAGNTPAKRRYFRPYGTLCRGRVGDDQRPDESERLWGNGLADAVQRRADRNKVREAESQVSAARETLRVMDNPCCLRPPRSTWSVTRFGESRSAAEQLSRAAAHAPRTPNTLRRRPDNLGPTSPRRGAIGGRRSQLARGRRTLTTTRANYRRIIGNDPENFRRRLRSSGSRHPRWPRDRSRRRAEPSVTAAMYGVDVALLQVKIAEGALWPTLAVQGNVSSSSTPT